MHSKAHLFGLYRYMVPPNKMCQQGRENLPKNFSLFNEHCSCVVCVEIWCTNFGSHDYNHHTHDHLQFCLWASILISERLEKEPKWEEVGIRKGEAGVELIGRKANRGFHNNGLSQAPRISGFKTKHSVPYGQSNYWFKGQWTQQIVKSNPLIAKADSPTINPLQWLYILILFLNKARFAIWRLEAEWKYKGPPCWSPTVQDSRSATAVPSFQPRLLPLLKNQDLAHSEIQPVLFSWGIQCNVCLRPPC